MSHQLFSRKHSQLSLQLFARRTAGAPRRRRGIVRTSQFLATVFAAVFAAGCESANSSGGSDLLPEHPRLADATFAGGCFWCMEPPFEKLNGVEDAISGYTGGSEAHPAYEDVAYGRTSHLEAVRIQYDPQQVSYKELLAVFWKQIDPTDAGGQFVDRGPHYATAIFYHNAEQKRLAEESKVLLAESGLFDKPIVTQILPAEDYYRAEAYHQDFYVKSEAHYKRYRSGSGRDRFLERVWKGRENLFAAWLDSGAAQENDGVVATDATRNSAVYNYEARYAGWRDFQKPSEDKLREQLTDRQYKITQEDGTEPPFRNEYWDNKKPGIYVDVVSGEPLFSSTDKFRSGTGWPSFTKPLEPDLIVEKRDVSYGMVRTEVRSKIADSHLGHVFNDGPQPTGLRYCINSAALRFIPAEELEAQGYGEYAKLFQ